MLTTLEDKKAYARKFCEAFAPSDTGEFHFDWLTKDFGGKGTTCGYLVHNLAWALGCRQRWVNTSKPGCKYRIGENVIAIAGAPVFKAYDAKAGVTVPPEMSIVFISNNSTVTEHLIVMEKEVIEGERRVWYSWEAGKKNSEMKECLRKCRRVRSGSMLSDRAIKGWIPLEDIDCTEDEFDLTELFGVSGPSLSNRDPYTGEAR